MKQFHSFPLQVFRGRYVITRSFIAGAALSVFIYAQEAGVNSFALACVSTVAAMIGVYFWLAANKKEAFALGCFTALGWFWWIGLSFRFTEYAWLSPFAAPLIAVVYGVLFWLISFLPLYGRAVVVPIAFLYVEPFGFAWFKPDLMLVDSFFSAHKAAFFCLSVGIMSFIYARDNPLRKTYWQLYGTIFLLLACFLPTPAPPSFPKLTVKLVRTDINQHIKWNKDYIAQHAQEALEEIDKAIASKYDMIVLPEAAFALFLNREEKLVEALTKRSKHIAIVAGALHLKDDQPYNSAYIFSNGKQIIADKVFLVPFGEASPLPSWAGRFVNRLFFDDAIDYEPAQTPTDFVIKNYHFRMAICYEAAIEAMYRDAPPYMIAISNNGWFTPSIEPTLQKLLMRLYAKRYGKIVWHSANESVSEVIKNR